MQVKDYRRDLEIHVSGFDPPKPIQTFGQAGFDHLLLGAIKKAGYDKPTAIQAQALPAVLSGRDVLVRRSLWFCRQLSSPSIHCPGPEQLYGC